MEKKKPKILITGAQGMLGRYMCGVFGEEYEIMTLGRDGSNNIVCDLSKDAPEGIPDDLTAVVHCAGTNLNEDAVEVNFNGTKRLLDALDANVLKNFIYISSYEVYGKQEGEAIDEQSNTWTINEVGRSKILAEEEILSRLQDRDTVVTILRPSSMFGSGVSGWGNRLFNQVVNGRYVHVRGNMARRSLVTALDVAKVALKLIEKGGEYNVCDGNDRPLIQLCEAMSANAGLYKRMVFLPEKWAKLFMRIADGVPSLRAFMGSEVLSENSRTLTFSNAKLKKTISHNFYDTVEVIARRDKNYPYSDHD